MKKLIIILFLCPLCAFGQKIKILSSEGLNGKEIWTSQLIVKGQYDLYTDTAYYWSNITAFKMWYDKPKGTAVFIETGLDCYSGGLNNQFEYNSKFLERFEDVLVFRVSETVLILFKENKFIAVYHKTNYDGDIINDFSFHGIISKRKLKKLFNYCKNKQ